MWCLEAGPHLSEQSWGARVRQRCGPAGGHGTHLIGRGRPGLHLHTAEGSSAALKAVAAEDRCVSRTTCAPQCSELVLRQQQSSPSWACQGHQGLPLHGTGWPEELLKPPAWALAKGKLRPQQTARSTPDPTYVTCRNHSLAANPRQGRIFRCQVHRAVCLCCVEGLPTAHHCSN